MKGFLLAAMAVPLLSGCNARTVVNVATKAVDMATTSQS
jgi:hypothetical protein